MDSANHSANKSSSQFTGTSYSGSDGFCGVLMVRMMASRAVGRMGVAAITAVKKCSRIVDVDGLIIDMGVDMTC